jgi:hypothetical protein
MAEMGTWGALGCAVLHFKVFCIFAALFENYKNKETTTYGRM